MSPLRTLLYDIIQRRRARDPGRVPLLGIAGAQGAGKSYQCRRFVEAHPRVAHFSLDDVYWPKLKRRDLARFVHPLFITRGPPGTHDLDLAVRTIEALRSSPPPLEGEGVGGWGDVQDQMNAVHEETHDETHPTASALTPTPAPPPSRGRGGCVRLPRFLKARDERAPESEWPVFAGRPEAILFDGWCLGATPPPLSPPLNALETADTDGAWRAAQAKLLAEDYARFFARFDAIVYLKPPSWEIVGSWRAEQEVENLGRALTPDDHARLDRFMQHYERITRSMMAGGHLARWIVHLDERRGVMRIEERPNPPTPPP